MEPEQDTGQDLEVGRAIAKGVAIGTPVALVFLTLVIWIITDNDLGDSLATALLPGFLLGFFGGGFVGLALVMD